MLPYASDATPPVFAPLCHDAIDDADVTDAALLRCRHDVIIAFAGVIQHFADAAAAVSD